MRQAGEAERCVWFNVCDSRDAGNGRVVERGQAYEAFLGPTYNVTTSQWIETRASQWTHPHHLGCPLVSYDWKLPRVMKRTYTVMLLTKVRGISRGLTTTMPPWLLRIVSAEGKKMAF